MFLALSRCVALCETEKEETSKEYTRLVKLITDSNAIWDRYMNERFDIQFGAMDKRLAIQSRAMNEQHSNLFKLVNEYNSANFTLIITLHTIVFIYVTLVCSFTYKHLYKTITDQQRQIDDLKRELEEMKTKE